MILKTIDPASRMRTDLGCLTPKYCVWGSQQQAVRIYWGCGGRTPAFQTSALQCDHRHDLAAVLPWKDAAIPI